MRFNFRSRNRKTLLNHEGEKAWKMTPEMELYTTVVTTSLDNKFYEKGMDRVKRIRELISQVDAWFVAKLAIYAREEMYLRSIPLVLLIELAKVHKGDSLVSKTIARVIRRVDEITELLALYQLSNPRSGAKRLGKLSKQVQKGIALAFNKFDEYQFAKYNRDVEVTLKDALFLVHPAPKDEKQQALFDKIAAGTLEVPKTWEVEFSRLGQGEFQDADEKKEAFSGKWEEMISSGKLGYMALMRNLRNMLQADISGEHLAMAAARLADPVEVRRSKQFPFRFLSAYRELKSVNATGVSLIQEALEKAVLSSVDNIKGFEAKDKVFISCDTSGSMYSPVSRNSKVMMFDIGFVLAMLLRAKCREVITSVFAEKFAVFNLPAGGVLANADRLRDQVGKVGYATNGYLVIEHLLKFKMKMDKVLIFTDMQLWNSYGNGKSLSDLWMKYKAFAPGAKLYIFDLQGYGQAPINLERGDVALIAGWSDKVFDVLDAIESGADALSEIDKIVI